MKVRRIHPTGADGVGVGRSLRDIWNADGGRLATPVLFEGVKHEGAPEQWLPRVCEAAGLSSKEYIGGNSPRTRVAESVYTSTEYPQKETLSLHQELSYEHSVPDVLLFVCVTPPKEGGETPICDSRELHAALPPRIVDTFTKWGVVYRQRLPNNDRQPGTSWMRQFQTNDRLVCESYLDDRDVLYNWESDGALRIDRRRRGVRDDPRTASTVWFNQADQWDIRMSMDERKLSVFNRVYGSDTVPHSVTYGNGEQIDLDDLQTIKATALRIAETPSWVAGNVLAIDNVQHMHGRMPFAGDRRILVSMGDMEVVE